MRALVFSLTLILLVACGGGPAPQEPERLNVMLVLVDDWGWSDAGVFGSDLYLTPNIDRLAADGMRFTTGYAACTVCSPTRAALMTGKYPARTHVTDWIRGHQRPKAKLLPPEWTMKLEHNHTSLAEAFQAAGYRTAMAGKWHLEPTGEADEDDYEPTKHGFEINVAGNEWGAPPSYFWPYTRENAPGRTLGPMPEGGEEGEYLTDRLTDEVITILDEFKDDPFFFYFPYYNVHTPIQAKPEDVARFEPLVKDDGRHKNATYAGMVASVDRSIGRIRAHLEELGIADKTVILMTGDNGGLDRHGSGDPTENAPVRDGKGSAYEGGVRVPWIAFWPGVTEAGSTSAEPVISMDAYPTLLEIAGVEGNAAHNADVDGVSLVPVLRDPSASLGRPTLYWHYPHYHSMGATPYSAIRDGDWRLVEFYEDDHAELYNLAEDGSETTDLAEEMPDKVEELRGKIAAWRESVGAQDPQVNPDAED